MLEFESQFDCILIGTGNSGKATVEALKEKGKKAFYIELKPEMIATLISQHAVQQSAATGDPSSQTETHIIKQKDGDIILNRQTLHTETLETNTYTLQVTKQAETGQAVEQEDASIDMGSLYKESSHEQSGSNGDDLEVIEAQRVEYAKPPFSFFGERSPFRKKSLRRKQKLTFQDHEEPNEEYPIYQLERIHLEDEEEPDYNPEKDWNSTFSGNKIFPDEEEKETKQEPVYRERERKLRKKLSGKQRLQVVDSELDESYDSHKNNFSSTDDLSNNDLLQSFPDFYPHDFGPKTEYPEPEADLQNVSYHSLYEQPQVPETNQQNELLPLEPFSPRRRARSSKKTRFKPRRESLVEKVTRQIKEQNQQQSGYSLFPEEPSATNNQYSLFSGGQQPSVQPFSQETDNAKKNESPLKKTGNDDSETSLKRDEIELEDAYGDYSSWEEIMTPYSQNNRKRQEIDKIEKRKIALRGLHNLINNLG